MKKRNTKSYTSPTSAPANMIKNIGPTGNTPICHKNGMTSKKTYILDSKNVNKLFMSIFWWFKSYNKFITIEFFLFTILFQSFCHISKRKFHSECFLHIDFIMPFDIIEWHPILYFLFLWWFFEIFSMFFKTTNIGRKFISHYSKNKCEYNKKADKYFLFHRDEVRFSWLYVFLNFCKKIAL